jgi:hypothetical protein
LSTSPPGELRLAIHVTDAAAIGYRAEHPFLGAASWVLKYSLMLALIPVVVTGLALLAWPHRRFGYA